MFTASFDEAFRTEGLRIVKTPIRSPRANAFAERSVNTVRRECIDRLLILGRRHLEQVLTMYVAPTTRTARIVHWTSRLRHASGGPV
jgi:transposase InsO family protein